ncbi:MAG: hypothetical protein AAF512_01080 [Pseudomonadota bacterium]
MSEPLTARDEEEALEKLHAMGCTDGLPVVIPTRERVERMILSTGQDGDMLLGEMGPGKGLATIEKIATAAVMAGCLPDYMPVVIAAAQAVIDPRFDLTEMQATTHCTAPLIIVNGPARESCGGIASGFGALGPGHRANASIGRALRLAMINIGGGRPGEADMALLGHPGKFTYCLAENEEVSPFDPLHVARGFEREDSVVTVIGAEAPHSIIFNGDADDPDSYKSLLRQVALGLSHLGTNNAILRGGAAVAVFNPDHANVLARAGLSYQDIQQQLYELCANKFGDIKRQVPAFAKRSNASDDELIYAFNAPEDILLLVAGGTGLYTMVMPSWCAGPHQNSAVSIKVDLDQFCEIPGAN